jgi:cytochrome c oxidase cbb3-type subunit III
MSDFISGFWSWYVIVLTVAGIALCWVLISWMSEPAKKADEKAKATGHVWDETLQELNTPLPKWWLYLFHGSLAFSVVYLVLFPGLGTFAGVLKWTSTGQYDGQIKDANKTFDPLFDKYLKEDLKVLASNTEAMKTGERLYMNYCTNCHGSDARGAKGFPNLRDSDWLYGGTPEAIQVSVMTGRNGMMPAWGPVLGAEGLNNVAEYVLSLSGQKVDDAAAAAGKEKFKQLCVTCHGPDGKGMQTVGSANLTDNTWLYGGSKKTIMETIEKGRQGLMPAHGEFLGEAKVHLLSAYIYSLSAGAGQAAAK